MLALLDDILEGRADPHAHKTHVVSEFKDSIGGHPDHSHGSMVFDGARAFEERARSLQDKKEIEMKKAQVEAAENAKTAPKAPPPKNVTTTDREGRTVGVGRKVVKTDKVEA
jgi:hypothetical protein